MRKFNNKKKKTTERPGDRAFSNAYHGSKQEAPQEQKQRGFCLQTQKEKGRNRCPSKNRKEETGQSLQSRHQASRRHHREDGRRKALSDPQAQRDDAGRALGCGNGACVHRSRARLSGTVLPIRKTRHHRGDDGGRAPAQGTEPTPAPTDFCVQIISHCKNNTFILQLGCKARIISFFLEIRPLFCFLQIIVENLKTNSLEK